jgi:hypothetical protein
MCGAWPRRQSWNRNGARQEASLPWKNIAPWHSLALSAKIFAGPLEVKKSLS